MTNINNNTPDELLNNTYVNLIRRIDNPPENNFDRVFINILLVLLILSSIRAYFTNDL